MSRVVALLSKEHQLLDGFILLLEEEQNHLKLGLSESLPVLAAQKSQCIQALNNLDNELRQIVGDFSNNIKASVSDWPISDEERNAVAPHWLLLLEKASRAKKLNALNAQLVDMHLRNTKELLSSLIPTADAGPLYGSDGQANGSTGSRIIDAA